jgi:hypothetical protein
VARAFLCDYNPQELLQPFLARNAR